MRRFLVLPVGSTPWLLAHEIRLAWRGAWRRGTGRRGLWVVAALLLLATLALGVPLGLILRHQTVRAGPAIALIVDVALAIVFTLMLSASLAAATETFYTRGDLDLLLSAPLPPTRVLTVRAAAIAVNVFTGIAAVITPVLLPVALFGHPAWLAAYPVLAAMALAAAGLGLMLARGLFRLLGPRRTRAVAQVMAALIGGAIFLVSQARTLLGGSQASQLSLRMARAWEGAGPPAEGLLVPARAVLGEPGPLLLMLCAGGLLFGLADAWAGPGFASDAAAASGVSLGARAAPPRPFRFAGGVIRATFRKELRLLARDLPLLSQVLLRLFYLLPLTAAAVRAAAAHARWSLPGVVAAVTFTAGQVAGSLAWVTLSAEDEPDLIAVSPAPPRLIRRAKFAAATAPVGVLLAAPLLALLTLSPVAGAAAMAGSAAAAIASALINSWRPSPAKRSDFRRRRQGSWVVGLAEFLVCALIAVAASLTAASWPLLALIPAVLAAIALGALSRDDAGIAGRR